MRKRVRLALAAVAAFALVLVAIAGWMLFGPRRVPSGQPPLATLSAASLPAFKGAFNAAGGEVRLLVLLSPT